MDSCTGLAGSGATKAVPPTVHIVSSPWMSESEWRNSQQRRPNRSFGSGSRDPGPTLEHKTDPDLT